MKRQKILGIPSTLLKGVGFISGVACAIDMGATFANYDTSPTSEMVDCAALANDWLVVGDELRKAMNAYG